MLCRTWQANTEVVQKETCVSNCIELSVDPTRAATNCHCSRLAHLTRLLPPVWQLFIYGVFCQKNFLNHFLFNVFKRKPALTQQTVF